MFQPEDPEATHASEAAPTGAQVCAGHRTDWTAVGLGVLSTDQARRLQPQARGGAVVWRQNISSRKPSFHLSYDWMRPPHIVRDDPLQS